MKKLDLISPAGKILSSTALMLVLDCVDIEDARLEKLHWQICPFVPQSQNKEGENASQTFLNIALYRSNLKEAKSQISRLYESQFEEKIKSEVAGGSTTNTPPRKTKRKKI